MTVSSQFTVDSSQIRHKFRHCEEGLCHPERPVPSEVEGSEGSRFFPPLLRFAKQSDGGQNDNWSRPQNDKRFRPWNDKRYRLAAFVALFAMTTISALALELPDEVKGYYKDRISSAPGHSDGVAPTVRKAKVIEGVDIGRRESQEFDFSDESSSALAVKSWEALNKKDEQSLLAYTSRCIELYQEEARDQQAELSDFAPAGLETAYESLNNVAVCYFMLAELYKHKKDWEKSRENYKKAADKFYFSQYWDPRGWWWKPGKISAEEVKKIDEGYYEKE